jgi:hypothetical protein
MNLARYWKFIMAIVGGVVGMALAFAASKGLGTCTIDPATGAASDCVVFGMSQTQIMAILTMAFSSLGVGIGPKNAE